MDSINISWCSVKSALKVAFKYLMHGVVIAMAIRLVPDYGSLIDDKELAVIAITSAVTMFLMNKFLPDNFIALNI
jgi:hypothetical protein